MTLKARMQRISDRYQAKVAAAKTDGEVLAHFREFVRSAAAQCASIDFERLEAEAERNVDYEGDEALKKRMNDAIAADRTKFVLLVVDTLDPRLRDDKRKLDELCLFAATEHQHVFDRLLLSSRGGADAD